MDSPKPVPSRDLPSLSTSLLVRVQEMQPEAWSRLVEVFSPLVYRWARTAGLSEEDSADVVQDVFIAIAKNIGGFQRQKESGSFRSWLATITRNRVRDVFRKKKRHNDSPGGTEALQQLESIPAVAGATMADELEQSISLESLDARLPIRVLEIVRADCDPRTWEAFWMSTVKGKPAPEVATQLGMEIGSVYQAKSRILRRLRKRLSELP